MKNKILLAGLVSAFAFTFMPASHTSGFCRNVFDSYKYKTTIPCNAKVIKILNRGIMSPSA